MDKQEFLKLVRKRVFTYRLVQDVLWEFDHGRLTDTEAVRMIEGLLGSSELILITG